MQIKATKAQEISVSIWYHGRRQLLALACTEPMQAYGMLAQSYLSSVGQQCSFITGAGEGDGEGRNVGRSQPISMAD